MTKHEQRAAQVFAGSMVVNIMHSALASLPVKDAVRRAAGERRYRGLYRAAFNAHAVASYGLGALWFLRQPDRELYRLRGPWSWLARAAQAAGALLVLDLVRVVGFTRISGLGPLAGLLRGGPVPATPEAQGPPPAADGELVARGSFAHTRHPDAWPFFLIFWGWPRMTVNRAALAASFTIYTLAGVLHEEARLRAAYGAAHDRYRRAVPFLLPRLAAPQSASEAERAALPDEAA
jgi:protein-S-isoprenylcysteine O-methyltransferase Ste14